MGRPIYDDYRRLLRLSAVVDGFRDFGKSIALAALVVALFWLAVYAFVVQVFGA